MLHIVKGMCLRLGFGYPQCEAYFRLVLQQDCISRMKDYSFNLLNIFWIPAMCHALDFPQRKASFLSMFVKSLTVFSKM